MCGSLPLLAEMSDETYVALDKLQGLSKLAKGKNVVTRKLRRCARQRGRRSTDKLLLPCETGGGQNAEWCDSRFDIPGCPEEITTRRESIES